MTATSSRPSAWTAAGAALAAALAVVVSACSASVAGQSAGHRPAATVPAVGTLAARRAPAGWHRASMPGGAAVLSYPPGMHRVSADAGEVSAASFSPAGAFLLYLNATPKQGRETLRDWPSFRIEHLTEDTASSARLLAQSFGVRFIGGTGSCVIDSYVTKVKSNHYTELACFVQGRTSASVIIAAAPTSHWAQASGVLRQAVAAYQIR